MGTWGIQVSELYECFTSWLSKSYLQGGRAACCIFCFCLGGLPVAKEVTRGSASVHSSSGQHRSLAIWTTQRPCFLRRAGQRQGLTHSPKVITKWQETCLHRMIQHHQVSHSLKTSWSLSSAVLESCLRGAGKSDLMWDVNRVDEVTQSLCVLAEELRLHRPIEGPVILPCARRAYIYVYMYTI